MTASIQSLCSICNKPVDLPLPEDFESWDADLRSSITTLAGKCVHDACGDDVFARYQRRKLDSEYAARISEWAGLCPPAYQDTDEARLNRQWHAEALAWEYGPKGLTLVGPSRSGKSRTAWCIAKRQHIAGRAVVARTHQQLLTDIARGGHAGTGKEALRFIQMLRNADLLLIDDFGKGKLSDIRGDATQAAGLFHELIDHRCRNNNPMIITTQWKGSMLIQRLPSDYASGLVERIREFTTAIAFQTQL